MLNRIYIILSLAFLLATGLTSADARILNRYPQSGSLENSTSTTIGIRSDGVLPDDVSFEVLGSKSGREKGITHFSIDGSTAIFSPATHFQNNELVTVRMYSSHGEILDGFSFRTQVRDLPIDQALLQAYREDRSLTSKSAEAPQDLPIMIVTVDSSPTPGKIFISNFGGPPTDDNFLQLNEHGSLLNNVSGTADNFRLQDNGTITYFDRFALVDYIMDTTWNLIDTAYAVNGYTTDSHELRIRQDGSYYLLGIIQTTADLTAYGGSATAKVVSNAIQVFDKKKNLLFEWRGIDHYKVADASHVDLTTQTVDFEHANSIDEDKDGNYILSNRNLDEITKIDGKNGNILWRFGGKHNEFKVTNDTLGFSWQHDALWIPNGHMTLLDNGNNHPVPESRALEYSIDQAAKTATLVWSFRHNPPTFSQAMGNVERLPNGNTFIGWGVDTVAMSEVTSSGKLVFELKMPVHSFSYRAYKYLPAGFKSVASEKHATAFLRTERVETGWNIIVSGLADAKQLGIYDAIGRQIANFEAAGLVARETTLHWSPPAAGNYFVVLQTASGAQVLSLQSVR